MAIDPERVKALFQAAIERGDPASRHAFLDDEIGGDAELRDRLDALGPHAGSRPRPGARRRRGAATAGAGGRDGGRGRASISPPLAEMESARTRSLALTVSLPTLPRREILAQCATRSVASSASPSAFHSARTFPPTRRIMLKFSRIATPNRSTGSRASAWRNSAFPVSGSVQTTMSMGLLAVRSIHTNAQAVETDPEARSMSIRAYSIPN